MSNFYIKGAKVPGKAVELFTESGPGGDINIMVDGVVVAWIEQDGRFIIGSDGPQSAGLRRKVLSPVPSDTDYCD